MKNSHAAIAIIHYNRQHKDFDNDQGREFGQLVFSSVAWVCEVDNIIGLWLNLKDPFTKK